MTSYPRQTYYPSPTLTMTTLPPPPTKDLTSAPPPSAQSLPSNQKKKAPKITQIPWIPPAQSDAYAGQTSQQHYAKKDQPTRRTPTSPPSPSQKSSQSPPAKKMETFYIGEPEDMLPQEEPLYAPADPSIQYASAGYAPQTQGQSTHEFPPQEQDPFQNNSHPASQQPFHTYGQEYPQQESQESPQQGYAVAGGYSDQSNGSFPYGAYQQAYAPTGDYASNANSQQQHLEPPLDVRKSPTTRSPTQAPGYAPQAYSPEQAYQPQSLSPQFNTYPPQSYSADTFATEHHAPSLSTSSHVGQTNAQGVQQVGGFVNGYVQKPLSPNGHAQEQPHPNEYTQNTISPSGYAQGHQPIASTGYGQEPQQYSPTGYGQVPAQGYAQQPLETYSSTGYAQNAPVYAQPGHSVTGYTEQLTTNSSQGPEAAIGGCYFSQSEVTSHLSLLYEWPLEYFTQVMESEEKMVSAPFGAKNQMYQLVLYPKGVADGLNTHLSLFVRPVKNDSEIQEASWFRAVNHIAIHITNPAYVSDENFYIISETSGPDFPGFSEADPGWGSTTFLELGTVSSAISPQGAIKFQCELGWPQLDAMGSVQHTLNLPTSLVSPFESEIFGTTKAGWLVKTRCDGELGSENLGVFLAPNQFKQPLNIASLTLKLYAGPNLVTAKTFTGGFLFSQASSECGWEKFCALADLDPNMPWSLSVQLDYLVDQLMKSEVKGDQLESINKELSSLQNSNAYLQSSMKNYDKTIQDLRNTITAKNESTQKLKGALENLRSELAAAYQKQEDAFIHKGKLARTKSRLAELLSQMSQGQLPEPVPEGELNKSVHLEMELRKYQVVNARLEGELAAARGELSSQTWLQVESKVRDVAHSPSAFSDASDTVHEVAPTLSETMAKVREEIVESRTALSEAAFKMPLAQTQEDDNERAGISADLVIRLAELEVARALLMSALPVGAFHISPDVAVIKADLADIRKKLVEAIRSVDTDGAFAQPAPVPIDNIQVPSQPPSVSGMSPLKLDQQLPVFQPVQAPSNMSVLPTTFEPPRQRAESVARNAIIDNVAEMKSVLSQFKEIISQEPLRIEELVKTAVVSPAAPKKRFIAEPWTPVPPPLPWSQQGKEQENFSSNLDPSELMKLLKDLDLSRSRARRSTFSLIFLFSLFLAFAFSFYSSVHIVCAPQQKSDAWFASSPATQEACEKFILPAWTQLSDSWHKSAEYLVVDVVPAVLDGASKSKRAFRSFSLGARKKLKQAYKQIQGQSKPVGFDNVHVAPVVAEERSIVESVSVKPVMTKEHTIPKMPSRNDYRGYDQKVSSPGVPESSLAKEAPSVINHEPALKVSEPSILAIPTPIVENVFNASSASSLAIPTSIVEDVLSASSALSEDIVSATPKVPFASSGKPAIEGETIVSADPAALTKVPLLEENVAESPIILSSVEEPVQTPAGGMKDMRQEDTPDAKALVTETLSESLVESISTTEKTAAVDVPIESLVAEGPVSDSETPVSRKSLGFVTPSLVVSEESKATDASDKETLAPVAVEPTGAVDYPEWQVEQEEETVLPIPDETTLPMLIPSEDLKEYGGDHAGDL